MKRKLFPRFIALMLAVCMMPIFGLAQAEESTESDWVNFLLLCNEGMVNDKGNVGNTLMLVGLNPTNGKVRLAMFTWDTFIDYPGYDVPQKIDMPFRNNGAEAAVEVFNANFGTDINLFMSLNYLNLASLIDNYGGVDIDITRAERNALNGMVASKKRTLQAQIASGLLSQAVIDMLADEYYLNEFGPDTHLNGLQAVGFGWLQYDSVYNCCEREVEVIAALFRAVGKDVSEKVVFYNDANGEPDNVNSRRAINLDNVTDDDYAFIYREIAPIFEMSYNNLSDDDISTISLALAHVAYEASRQGVNVLDSLKTTVMPLEALLEYDIVAGAKGHLVDKEANTAALNEFLYSED